MACLDWIPCEVTPRCHCYGKHYTLLQSLAHVWQFTVREQEAVRSCIGDEVKVIYSAWLMWQMSAKQCEGQTWCSQSTLAKEFNLNFIKTSHRQLSHQVQNKTSSKWHDKNKLVSKSFQIFKTPAKRPAHNNQLTVRTEECVGINKSAYSERWDRWADSRKPLLLLNCRYPSLMLAFRQAIIHPKLPQNNGN